MLKIFLGMATSRLVFFIIIFLRIFEIELAENWPGKKVFNLIF